jgi:hypothetical protein
MAFHWTSVSAYIPLITDNYPIASGTGTVMRHAYPLHFNLTHERLWEGSRFGRLFATIAGDLQWNNIRDGYVPDLKAQVIYLPANSHIGISFLAKQAIGDYHATDAILGFPIVLIDKKAEPAVNFEFQLRFYDLGHTIGPGMGLAGHTAVGLTIGVPFSKIAF